MKDVVITSAVRSAIGKMGGSLSFMPPERLMAEVLNKSIEYSNIEKGKIEEVIIGQTKQSTDAPNIGRVASLIAGIPEEVPAYTVHRQCSSGLQAILNAVWQIQVGYGDIIAAGGVESMSTAPYYVRKARFGYKAGNGFLIDPNTESQPKSQPEDKYGTFNMGITAENLVEKYGISRKEQDLFAYSSQMKAVKAMETKRFKEEIVPIRVKTRKEEYLFEEDEHPRKNVTIDKLGKLKPVFKENGSVTAGNSSGRNDGAASLVVMSSDKAVELGVKPLAKFVSAGVAGVDPRIMGIGPVEATKKALKKADLNLNEIGLIELNEAFAAQSIAVIKELKLNTDIVNVNGGAIALGHPLGCTGARIVVTLVHEMIKRNVKYGLATICVAGGLGMSMILENTFFD